MFEAIKVFLLCLCSSVDPLSANTNLSHAARLRSDLS